jgi:hypothetical protein
MVYHGGVKEDSERGYSAHNGRDVSAPSGWVTTQQAARALDISPRTVRWHIEQGNLIAKPEGEGVRRSWLVSIDSVQAFRNARQAAGEMPRARRASVEAADIAAQDPGYAIRVLAEKLEDAAARAREYQVRQELTAQTESTLRAQLEEVQRRRDEAERERDELRRQLDAMTSLPSKPPQERAEADSEGAGEDDLLRSSFPLSSERIPWRVIALAVIAAVVIAVGLWLGYALVSLAL